MLDLTYPSKNRARSPDRVQLKKSFHPQQYGFVEAPTEY